MADAWRGEVADDVENRIAWAKVARDNTWSRADGTADNQRTCVRVGIPLFVLSGAAATVTGLAVAEPWSTGVLVVMAVVTGALISATVASFVLARKFARDRTAIFIEFGGYEVWIPKARRYLARFRSDSDYDPEAKEWDRLNAEREHYRVNALKALEQSDEATSQEVIDAANKLTENWRDAREKSDGGDGHSDGASSGERSQGTERASE